MEREEKQRKTANMQQKKTIEGKSQRAERSNTDKPVL